VFLARHGFSVDAMDISPTAVGEVNRLASELSLPLKGIQMDLETVNLPPSRYDLVIVFNYLDRNLIPKLKTALKPGGYVIYETFLLDQKEIGHPTNPRYLLDHNELLDLFREFRALFYREGMFAERGETRFVASLFAKKLERPGEG
jgi:SAM-dependent methyltransferase